MSINVDFYNFNKRINSTKIPSEIGQTYSCTLKDDCSILTPVIRLTGANASFKPVNYNYARIADFGRYYFVTDWKFAQGCWFASLNVDELASWKEDIGNSSQYISRCSTVFNGKISDNLYPATCEIETHRCFINTEKNTGQQVPTSLDKGFYVLTVISNLNEDVTESSSVTYYALTPSQYFLLSKKIFTGDFWEKVVAGSLKFNDYILGLKWFPYQPNNMASLGSLRPTIVIGNFPLVDVPAYQITKERINIGYTFKFYDLQKHPQEDFGFYMKCEPWSTYELYWKPIGKIPLDGRIIAKGGEIVLTVDVDLRTGEGLFRLSIGEESLADGSANFSANIPFSTMTIDLDGIKQAFSSFVGGSVSLARGDIIKSADMFTGTLGHIVNASTPNVTSSASCGNVTSLSSVPLIYTRFVKSVNRDIEQGFPCCEIKRIVELKQSFIIIQNPRFSIPCTKSEIEKINSFASGGFYYE